MPLVLGPALGLLLVAAFAALAAVHLWHLWQFQSAQFAHLNELETVLAHARVQKEQRQADLARRFDPHQLQPLLRERYGWVDPRDLIVRLQPPAKK
ncbi:septum formation initiator [Gloeobacter kilaueensis JS1]|uniref:Septum formation initiator n=1 Tax=Gloeobacter kilaueensis (strain ATCC BAA-2537 / CCAP 1431/1 / ULC 316 / JS1) TaxID=1183438 RepID=U5QMR6_GLOK1|nr:septum formation initiator [Gloeobacter kilaueensis JS1]